MDSFEVGLNSAIREIEDAVRNVNPAMWVRDLSEELDRLANDEGTTTSREGLRSTLVKQTLTLVLRGQPIAYYTVVKGGVQYDPSDDINAPILGLQSHILTSEKDFRGQAQGIAAAYIGQAWTNENQT